MQISTPSAQSRASRMVEASRVGAGSVMVMSSSQAQEAATNDKSRADARLYLTQRPLGPGSPKSALTSLKTTLGLVDDVDAALAAHNAAVPVALLQRAERVLDFHRSSPGAHAPLVNLARSGG